MPKIKIYKQKKCRFSECRKPFIPVRPFQTVCTNSYECALGLAREKERKRFKAETVVMRKAGQVKDRRYQLKRTQEVFNKMRKLQEYKWFADRGLEPECISCGRKNMDWCCGHLKTVSARGDLRFNELNTMLQCNHYCNMNLSGNLNGTKTTRGFIEGIKARFGEVEAEKVFDYVEEVREKTWICNELIEMRRVFSEEIRRLERLSV